MSPRLDRSRRLWLILLGLLMVVGLALRLRGADVRLLDNDEAFSWRVASRPLKTMVVQVAGDTHPLLHFLVLKFVMLTIGSSPLALRASSIVAGVATIPAVFGLSLAACRYAGVAGRRACWAALVAATYVTIHPAHIAASNTGRMYSFVTGFAALSSWCLIEALARPAPPRRLYAAYALAAALMLHSHNFAWFLFAAQIGFAALEICSRRVGRDRLPFLLAAGTLAVLLYAPWLPVFFAQAKRVHDGFWIPPVTVETFAELFERFLFGADLFDRPTSITLACLLMAGLCWVVARSNNARAWSLPVQVILVWIMAVLVSTMGGRPILQERYLLIACPALAGWCAVAIATTRPTVAAWSLACLLLIPTGHASVLYLARPWPSPRSTLEAIEFLRGARQPGDLMLVRRPGLVNVFGYYQTRTPGHDLDVRYLLDTDDLRRIGQTNHISSFDSDEMIAGDRPDQFPARRVWMLNGACDLAESGWSRQDVITFGAGRGEDSPALQLISFVHAPGDAQNPGRMEARESPSQDPEINP